MPDQTHYVEWQSVPHFYNKDNLIVQYIGADEETLMLLSSIFGEQFAGGNAE